MAPPRSANARRQPAPFPGATPSAKKAAQQLKKEEQQLVAEPEMRMKTQATQTLHKAVAATIVATEEPAAVSPSAETASAENRPETPTEPALVSPSSANGFSYADAVKAPSPPGGSSPTPSPPGGSPTSANGKSKSKAMGKSSAAPASSNSHAPSKKAVPRAPAAVDAAPAAPRAVSPAPEAKSAAAAVQVNSEKDAEPPREAAAVPVPSVEAETDDAATPAAAAKKTNKKKKKGKKPVSDSPEVDPDLEALAEAKMYQTIPADRIEWAKRAIKHAEEYSTRMTRHGADAVRLTRDDAAVHGAFRAAFPDYDVTELDPVALLDPVEQAKWIDTIHTVAAWLPKAAAKSAAGAGASSASASTLIRVRARDVYQDDNMVIVSMGQFYLIEVARNREGANDAFAARVRAEADKEAAKAAKPE
ncbi:polysaccharide biosynthesis domain containing protein 1 [Blastocladiella emersonii ATCC 22665]|nr:polysaccharide biosynthesis domain containing protein 1 [Blastocladiella emersonii ATCC 22665]